MICIEHLTKRFGRFVAVDNVSLTLEAGDSVALWGTNLTDEKYLDSYIDKSALVRAGLAAIAQNLKLVGDGRRVGLRATVRF